MPYYIAGAIYDWNTKEFELVTPTIGLPYVSNQHENFSVLQKCTSHHAGYYRLSEDFSNATLVRRTWEVCDKCTPDEVNLNSKQVAQIKESIKERGI